MKAMLQFIAAAACVAVLTACGGGDKTPKDVVVVQPDYKLTTTTVGTGRAAAAGDIVTFNYVGYLYDSTKSDFKGDKIESSLDAGVAYAATVGVGAMLTGWDQSLLGMQPGGARTAILPANLAYGANERDEITVKGITYPAIPANSALVYDFQMISVSPQVTIPSTPAPTVTTITDVVVGTGATATVGKAVTVNYTGWLYDGTRANFKGTQFDSSLTAGRTPLAVTVGTGVVAGFSTGITGMQVGGKRTVIIPADQGYGATAQTDSNGVVTIPANSVLVFDIQLLTVQ